MQLCCFGVLSMLFVLLDLNNSKICAFIDGGAVHKFVIVLVGSDPLQRMAVESAKFPAGILLISG